MTEGTGRGGGQGPPPEPGPDATPSDDPPRPRPRPPRAGASKATAGSKSAGGGKAARPAKSAAARKDTAKPRKAEPANRATGKKAATIPSPGGAPAKKAAAPKKLGAAGSGPPASARTRSEPAGPRPETEPTPPAAPDTSETPPPRPIPPPSSPPPPPAPPPPVGGSPTPAWGPQGWAPPPTYAPPTSPGVDSLAITSMVLGITAVPLFFLFAPAILAIVLGLLARRNIKAEPDKGGKGMATAGVVLGILSLIGAVLFVVSLVLSDDDSGGSLRYSTLQVGDCYDAEFYDERNVDPRLCSEDHYREVFAVIDHPAPPGAEYPGRVSLRRYGERECTTRFPAYVGRTYDESRLRIVVVFPPRDAWEEENLRRIVCAAARPDDEDLTRTVRDSGI
jgi:hypothetical protein